MIIESIRRHLERNHFFVRIIRLEVRAVEFDTDEVPPWQQQGVRNPGREGMEAAASMGSGGSAIIGAERNSRSPFAFAMEKVGAIPGRARCKVKSISNRIGS